MNNNLLQLKIKERLNKISSSDYDNIECWKVVEAFNKAQLSWTRRRLREAEENLTRIDDLQILLTPRTLKGRNYSQYFETVVLPDDYLAFSRMVVYGSTEDCPKKRSIKVYEAQEADADVLLTDDYKKPSFEWAETFCTLLSNKIRIYTDSKFNVDEPVLTYYRLPRPIQIAGCSNPSNGSIYSTNHICEFKDDIAEILVDEAASILAGDVQDTFNYQRTKQSAEQDN